VSENLVERILRTPVVQSLPQRLEKGGVLSWNGVALGAQAVIPVVLRRLLPDHVIVVVCEGLKSQEQAEQDIGTWLGVAGLDQGLQFYADWEVLPHESKLPHADVISDRLATLLALSPFQGIGAEGPSASSSPLAVVPPIIVTNIQALMQRTFCPEEVRARTRRLQRGDLCDPLDLIEWLEDQGYEPEAQVTERGELSLRGGIVDVFPLTSSWPVRLEFFGNDVESLRYFDPVSQVSRETVESIVLSPAGELGMLKRRETSAAPGATPPRRASLADHLPARTLVIVREPDMISQSALHYAEQVPDGDPFFVPWQEISSALQARGIGTIELRESSEDPPDFSSLEPFCSLGLGPLALPITETRQGEFFAQIHRWLRQDYQVHVFCNNEGEQQRFQEIWADLLAAGEARYGPVGPEPMGAAVAPFVDPRLNGPVVVQGTLSRGFLCEAGRLVVVTDAEVFGRYRVTRARRLRSVHAQAAPSALEINFADLTEGDLVVHVQYGIGRYLGLQVLPASPGREPVKPGAAAGSGPVPGASQECLVIEYAPRETGQPPPKLYVPVVEAHLVSKYVGAGRARPSLNTLGGGRWMKAKAQAARAVRDLAAELLSVQAARASLVGHACPPDTPWQREFESAFLYEETRDQARAIAETKQDLETPRPMDRLICGDVGFGKTEVALRAAFKVIMSGKQAAVLVPTTVLAQQHFNTFRERMADYPVRVELLSRYRSRREQASLVRELAAGSVDIVIGTHRLLQSDIAFKDLGLVVIDEEQRFGVLHKEKFKRLRRSVDVLTLSATPIPRTLYLALTGARDMSTLETPPQDRLPVETHVVPYDERVIRDAIRRELNRQGQVFYLHNRIETIETVGQRLRALVPEARLAIGHGQMNNHELEAVMARFVNGQVDVLLSTTIIESGLDIPNANTIIIDRADRFGLSDLYQLRGRVGRYKHQAYAYLLLPRHATLLADARKRISAIRQYSSLGSGFKIALRDLEIRGAGNLLGIEQSGHITAVGFELYCQLLKQSISTLKGERVKPRVAVQVRLDFVEADPAQPRAEAPVSSETRTRRARPLAPDPAQVPREVAVYYSEPGDVDAKEDEDAASCPVDRITAALPLGYVPEPQQRIDIHRKLAQANDLASLEQLRGELRDRFGPLPLAADRLLQVAELKILAAARGVTHMETRGNKLMLTRNQQYVMVNDRFPRLQQKTAAGRLQEIRKLLLAFS
jgi:transcription-repair coupling factor (superfamily II helicase)